MDFGHPDPNITRWAGVNGAGAGGNFTTQQYLFGPRLLAPVTLPNMTKWDVYLPKTANTTSTSKPWTFWYELLDTPFVYRADTFLSRRWTNQTFTGGQGVTDPAPREHVPLFHLGTREELLSGNVF